LTQSRAALALAKPGTAHRRANLPYSHRPPPPLRCDKGRHSRNHPRRVFHRPCAEDEQPRLALFRMSLRNGQARYQTRCTARAHLLGGIPGLAETSSRFVIPLTPPSSCLPRHPWRRLACSRLWEESLNSLFLRIILMLLLPAPFPPGPTRSLGYRPWWSPWAAPCERTRAAPGSHPTVLLEARALAQTSAHSGPAMGAAVAQTTARIRAASIILVTVQGFASGVRA
jgi:hypothetical protein